MSPARSNRTTDGGNLVGMSDAGVVSALEALTIALFKSLLWLQVGHVVPLRRW